MDNHDGLSPDQEYLSEELLHEEQRGEAQQGSSVLRQCGCIYIHPAGCIPGLQEYLQRHQVRGSRRGLEDKEARKEYIQWYVFLDTLSIRHQLANCARKTGAF